MEVNWLLLINIISTRNAILEEKEKATSWGLLIKQYGHVYMHVIFLTFLFACLFFSCNFFFRIYNCVCKFDENKNKNSLKKNFSQGKVISIWLIRALKLQLLLLLFRFHQFLIAVISLTSSNVICSLPFLSVMLYFVYDDQNNDDSST